MNVHEFTAKARKGRQEAERSAWLASRDAIAEQIGG